MSNSEENFIKMFKALSKEEKQEVIDFTEFLMEKNRDRSFLYVQKKSEEEPYFD